MSEPTWPVPLPTSYFPTDYTTSQRRASRLWERWILERENWWFEDAAGRIIELSSDPICGVVEDVLLQWILWNSLVIPEHWLRSRHKFAPDLFNKTLWWADGRPPSPAHRLQFMPRTDDVQLLGPDSFTWTDSAQFADFLESSYFAKMVRHAE